ncbi:hypothetical protein OK18_00405 [Chryseobacterium gallinarum]|uniref:HTH araC/xylS-type domain-containing protein n=1 Tax=Chryseobacterium gallinarum TaxID=1324352 RepID=A0A0G3M2Q8_CHRGL|nr:hypothetical protein OK18_00405 [Chryseobacterium gallinarum]
MNHLFIRFLSIILLYLCESLFAQKKNLSEFYLLQRQYETRVENDSTALPLVEKLIKKAKNEKNPMQLYLGYTDARYYSPDPNVKLKYADSAIYVATKTQNDSLISSAYLSKGVVYYFYLKKYNLALNQYLKAFEKNKNNKDPYYRNKINYHIGVMKSYIGYYSDALDNFEEARGFFENEIKKDLHPNVMYGNQRGYNNTLHQMTVCYRNLYHFKKADSLVALGMANTWKNPDYRQEYSYYIKEAGIRDYRNRDYAAAIKSLKSSLPALIAVNDFAWVSVSYAYLGKAHWKLGNEEEGIKNYKKIDSIFTKHSFLLPEVRDIYEELITYYRERNDFSTALYYTMQLIKADKIMEKDFRYLSSKIQKEYDTQRLLQEKIQLERKVAVRGWIWLSLAFSIIIFVCYWVIWVRSRKKVFGKNSFMGIHFSGSSLNLAPTGTFRIRHYKPTDLGKDVVEDILRKLAGFEMNEEFLQAKTDLKNLAKKFDVNPNYLSHVINEHKGSSFNRYLSELRIHYITEKLRHDPLYRKYNSASLAKHCGIASRTNFSALFSEINGISFSQYLHNLKNELNTEEV